MKLIIAEKPNLAMNIANALGVKERKDGYIILEKEYIVSWAVGHLLKLKDIKDYEGQENLKWKDYDTPFLPKIFEWKVKNDSDMKAQIKILKKLIKENNLESIVNCGDSDREGQIIIDILLEHLNYKGKVERLWLPDQTAETIKDEITKMKDNSEYRNLSNEGIARTYMDWLLGINLTLFLTNKSGELLKCGRVLIPIVKYIYDRDMAIKNFKPEKYYAIENTKYIKLALNKKYKLAEFEEVKNKIKELNSNKAIVKDIKEKEIKKQPKKLFSLSKLQVEMSKKFGFNSETTLKNTQKLYEQGYLTYPRTNTEYLAEAEIGKVEKIIAKIKDDYGYKNIELKNKKTIFDDSKIESHSAIIPTLKLPIIADLNDEEQKLYTTVLNRFLANFTIEDTIISCRSMEINVGKEEFKIKGYSIKQKGFFFYEEEKLKDNLPNYNTGDSFEIEFKEVKKETKPPVKVSETQLINYLENPLRKYKLEDENEENDEKIIEESDDTEEYKQMLAGIQIGTVATQAPTISKVKKLGYINQVETNFEITEKGIKVIEILEKLGINLYEERQIQFSKILREVYKNQKSINEVVEEIIKELNKIFTSDVEIEKIKKTRETIGICPICGKNIYERKATKTGKTFYSCDGYKDGCSFTLWDEMKYFDNILKINKIRAKNLIAGKKVAFKLIGKNKKEYEGYLKLKITDYNNKKYINFENAGYKSSYQDNDMNKFLKQANKKFNKILKKKGYL